MEKLISIMPFKAVPIAATPLIVATLGLLGTQGNTNIKKASEQLVD